MNTFITLLLLGISLSMDAISLSIFLGTILNKKQSTLLILSIGTLHFIMPILGALTGYKFANIISVNGEAIFAFILFLLAIQILVSLYKKETINKKFSSYEIILLAFGVSLDSFSIGFGLSFNDSFMIFASIIFSFCSIFFTYLGFIIGKYANAVLGIYSKLLGAILLLIMGVIHLI